MGPHARHGHLTFSSFVLKIFCAGKPSRNLHMLQSFTCIYMALSSLWHVSLLPVAAAAASLQGHTFKTGLSNYTTILRFNNWSNRYFRTPRCSGNTTEFRFQALQDQLLGFQCRFLFCSAGEAVPCLLMCSACPFTNMHQGPLGFSHRLEVLLC